MKTYIGVMLGLCLASPAFAEISVVNDDTQVEGIYSAKVISKSIVTDIVPRGSTEIVCERIAQTVHTDRYETVIKVIPKNDIRCKPTYTEKYMRVISGYYVVFDYKGQLKSIQLDYDPGEYIKLKE